MSEPDDVSAISRSRPGAHLTARLTARLPEVERAIFTCIEVVANPGVNDPDYLIDLRDSVRVAVRYALRAPARGAEEAGPPPDALLDQVGGGQERRSVRDA